MKISAQNPYLQANIKKQNNVAFGGLTNNKMYRAIESKVIDTCVWTVNKKSFQNLITKTNKFEKLQENLTSHLIVLGSTVLSGFYVLKTVKNKDLDEDKRKTLAINQGLTWAISTAMAYTFDSWARKAFTNNIINKFMDVNKGEDPAKLAKWKSGFSLARSIIIIDAVYRFIAPVIVTPVANHIGNKLRESKRAKN